MTIKRIQLQYGMITRNVNKCLHFQRWYVTFYSMVWLCFISYKIQFVQNVTHLKYNETNVNVPYNNKIL